MDFARALSLVVGLLVIGCASWNTPPVQSGDTDRDSPSQPVCIVRANWVAVKPTAVVEGTSSKVFHGRKTHSWIEGNLFKLRIAWMDRTIGQFEGEQAWYIGPGYKSEFGPLSNGSTVLKRGLMKTSFTSENCSVVQTYLGASHITWVLEQE